MALESTPPDLCENRPTVSAVIPQECTVNMVNSQGPALYITQAIRLRRSFNIHAADFTSADAKPIAIKRAPWAKAVMWAQGITSGIGCHSPALVWKCFVEFLKIVLCLVGETGVS